MKDLRLGICKLVRVGKQFFHRLIFLARQIFASLHKKNEYIPGHLSEGIL